MSTLSLKFVAKLNPVWRMVAARFAKACERCGQSRLYSIFDAYVTREKPNCTGCSAAFMLARPLMDHIFGKTDLVEEDVKRLIGDRLVRRSMLNVVRGISHFGIRTPQPTAVPVVIVWNYTNRCNLGCIHCHQDSGKMAERELTTEEAFKAIDRMGDAGLSILTFSGGEPLVRKDVFDAIERADDAGMLCTIASNATLMTREVVDRLHRSGIRRVEVGLDGCSAKTHDFLRNTPGALKATIQGIKNCVERGFEEVCATMTLHKMNVGELKGTVELAERLGISRFYLNRLIPAGRGKDAIYLDTTKEQRADALEYIYGRFYDSVVGGNGIQCYSRGMTYYGRLGYERSGGTIFTVSEALSGYSRMWRERFGGGISKLVRRYASGFGGCSAGITYAGLTASGELIPCVPAPIMLGNLLKEDLEEIWVNNELLNYIRRRSKLKGACGDCVYNFICGGCRYTAYVVKGDWLEADPSCPFGPSESIKFAE